MDHERIYNFDLKKIIAAICIVLHHFWQMSNLHIENGVNFYGGFFPFGYLVELFFMISGFLMAMNIKPKEPITKQIVKKLKRLWPMAALSVLVMYLIHVLYLYLFGVSINDWNYNFQQVATSFLLVNQGWIIEYFPAVNNPIWYVCILLWLTIVFVVISNVSKGNEKIIIFASFIFVIIGFLGNRVGIDFPFMYSTDCRGYGSFFIGVLLFFIYQHASIRLKYIGSITAMILAISSFIILKKINWYILTGAFFPSIILLSTLLPQCKYRRFCSIGGGLRLRFICGSNRCII